MHELSIAGSLIERVAAVAREQGASAVVTITLAVGKLSGVEKEALEFAFPLAAEGTLAEGANLVIEEKSVAVRCEDCGNTTAPSFPFLVCERCGSSRVQVLSGRELTIRAIELALPDPPGGSSGV